MEAPGLYPLWQSNHTDMWPVAHRWVSMEFLRRTIDISQVCYGSCKPPLKKTQTQYSHDWPSTTATLNFIWSSRHTPNRPMFGDTWWLLTKNINGINVLCIQIYRTTSSMMRKACWLSVLIRWLRLMSKSTYGDNLTSNFHMLKTY